MHAIVLKAFGSVQNLSLEDIAMPVPGAGQVLVRIEAGSLNPIDVKTRVGKGAANFARVVPPVVLGWDMSGVIERCGPDAGRWKPGDEVFGSVGFPGLGRTNAEYTVVDIAHLARKPASVSHEDAAAASMAGLTAWQALTRHGRPVAGQKVLVHAASGGVGHIAVQIAKSFGAHVTGTSSAANREFVLSLGADEHIDYRAQPVERYRYDFDFILDLVGGETTVQSMDLLASGGTLISILPPSEEIAGKARQSNRHFHFVLMESAGTDMAHIAALLESGLIQPRIAHRIALEDLGKAHEQLETGRTVGKIVILH